MTRYASSEIYGYAFEMLHRAADPALPRPAGVSGIREGYDPSQPDQDPVAYIDEEIDRLNGEIADAQMKIEVLSRVRQCLIDLVPPESGSANARFSKSRASAETPPQQRTLVKKVSSGPVGL